MWLNIDDLPSGSFLLLRESLKKKDYLSASEILKKELEMRGGGKYERKIDRNGLEKDR